jgi:hypothetical protein
LTVAYANAYEIDFAELRWDGRGPLCVVGNPPWVTSAALGRAESGVLQPPRSNLKRLRGLAARTGAANFDVAEFLILKLLRDLRAQPLHLAMLVKESVARNLLASVDQLDLGVTRAEIVRIDARAWFDVSVDACCLLLATTAAGVLDVPVPIRAAFDAPPTSFFAPPAAAPGGTSRYVFRQGIKHDAADIFELRARDGRWYNGFGDQVDVEPDYLFPLRKARSLHLGNADESLALVVPQRRLGAPTSELQQQAPRLWRYLTAHSERIAARKSSIYRNAPPFAFFGIGPYSFAPWKVAVAGLYPDARFRVIGPEDGRPVVFGDTAYFVPFADESAAREFGRLCARPAVAALIASRVVRGKRPITKALLDGIDWETLGAGVT